MAADPGAPVAVARSLAEGFARRAERYDRDGTFPVEDVEDLRRRGLLGLMVPARLGGLGAGFADYAAVARELASGNPSTALVFNMHASLTGALALTPDGLARDLGAPDRYFSARDEVLAAAAAGSLFLVAMSEPGVGARLSAVTTTYAPEGDGWRIRGRKSFCSGAGHAEGYLVAARSVDGGKVSQFLVPAGDGLVVEPTWDSLGMRATASHDLLLDVHVPADALLGGVEGLAPLLAQVMPQWLVASYAAIYVGVAESAITQATFQLSARGLGRLAAVRSRLGRADAMVHAAWLATLEAARRIDDSPGQPETNAWVYRSKLLAGDCAMEVAASMVEACGAAATLRPNPLERIFRDARCGALQPATSDVCADWLGVARLGGDPDHDGAEPRW